MKLKFKLKNTILDVCVSYVIIYGVGDYYGRDTFIGNFLGLIRE
jgi:hypothetical protein